MDILKMSKIEKLNKVSKKKSEILECDENALKFILLAKKSVTITFLGISGTKSSIQLYPLLGYNQKVPINEFHLCYHNSVETFNKIVNKFCILCSKSSKKGYLLQKEPTTIQVESKFLKVGLGF